MKSVIATSFAAALLLVVSSAVAQAPATAPESQMTKPMTDQERAKLKAEEADRAKVRAARSQNAKKSGGPMAPESQMSKPLSDEERAKLKAEKQAKAKMTPAQKKAAAAQKEKELSGVKATTGQ